MIAADVENFLEKMRVFQAKYPQAWQSINEALYSQTDMNLGDLENLLQVFSEITNHDQECVVLRTLSKTGQTFDGTPGSQFKS